MVDILKIEKLSVGFYASGKLYTAVEDVTFGLKEAETLVLAGESGSGKTVTALSIARILPPAARVFSGAVWFYGQNLMDKDAQYLTKIRGRQISYIFQEPSSYLNPVISIGNQLAEAILAHGRADEDSVHRDALELLGMVNIPDPERIIHSYPHQLSGGMNQRVFLAMALASRPKLLIADEPTTSLDVTTEAQILELLLRLKARIGFSMIFITHNLSIARKIADRICIMYRGRVVEEGSVNKIFTAPVHFHTRELIAAYERIGRI